MSFELLANKECINYHWPSAPLEISSPIFRRTNSKIMLRHYEFNDYICCCCVQAHVSFNFLIKKKVFFLITSKNCLESS